LIGLKRGLDPQYVFLIIRPIAEVRRRKEEFMTGVGFASFAIVAAVVVVGAQGGGGQGGGGARGGGAPPPANAAPARPPTTYDASKTQIVRGCLKPAPTAGMFAIADAVEVKAGTPSTSKQTYTIVGVIPPSVKLKDHVNHKVELSGTIIDGGKFDMADFKMVSTTCP
jgi:hypothetical protein